MFALSQPPQVVHPHADIPNDQALNTSRTVTKVTDRRAYIRQTSIDWNDYLQWGFSRVTGLIRFYTPSEDVDSQTTTMTQSRLLRVQVQMPTWLCASVLDAAFRRSYAGWACSLNVYGNIWSGSVEYQLVTDAIGIDDVDKIRCLFQERRCSPVDHLVFSHMNTEQSLMEVSNLGPAQVHTIVICSSRVVAHIC